jgi:hypothetical protein
MTEHPHVKSARHLAEKAKANMHETNGYFEGSSGADKTHPRVTAAQELSDMADQHHKALSGFMAAQPNDIDWKNQTPTGEFPKGRR